MGRRFPANTTGCADFHGDRFAAQAQILRRPKPSANTFFAKNEKNC
jgi:hypothetical protein